MRRRVDEMPHGRDGGCRLAAAERISGYARHDLGISDKLKPIQERVSRMVREEIIPLGWEYLKEVGGDGGRWSFPRAEREPERVETRARSVEYACFVEDRSRASGIGSLQLLAA